MWSVLKDSEGKTFAEAGTRQTESRPGRSVPLQFNEASNNDALPDIRPPWTVFSIVAMWTLLELGAVIIYKAGAPNGQRNPDAVFALLLGGISAGVMFMSTWWILGARPVDPDDSRFVVALRADRIFRVFLLLIALVSLFVATSLIDRSAAILGHSLAVISVAMVFPIMYRQITGRRIAKCRPQQKSAFDIRGLMLVTFAMASAGAMASVDGVYRSETFAIAAAFGVTFGLVWFALMGMLMKHPYIWVVFSLFGLALNSAIIAGVGILGPYGPDKTVAILAPLTAGLYLHGLMYWFVTRTADYRLA
tara:strand:- start:3287 stop:4204 length:918 start_codon:yes stop_codon:yes gene_type:complete